MATGIGAVSCAVGVAVGFIIWITKEVARPLKKAEVGLPPIPSRGLGRCGKPESSRRGTLCDAR